MDGNSKLVADLYAAFARGDIPFILERVSDDVRWEASDSPEMPYGGRYEGKNDLGRFFGGIANVIDVKSFEPKTYLSSGDEVMATGVWSGVGRDTGKPFTSQWAHRFVVKNGKVAFYHGYEDTAVTAAALRK